MPSDEDRARSASPPRDDSEPRAKKAKTSSSGFKWKSKPSREEESEPRSGGRLERGYRDRDSYRDSRPRREDDRDGYRDSRRDDRDSRPRREERRDGGGDSYRPSEEQSREPAKDEKKPRDPDKPKKEKKDKKPKQITSSEDMIIVYVNDRLGTKAAIPCLASDSVKAFKAMVAAHIGRQPHEIMLKRQGERPFKDVLTLEDYGVSNGVQLDLELDTGD